MGLDFVQENQYINAPSKGAGTMDAELFEKLDKKISDLLTRHDALKEENRMLAEENNRLLEEREALKGRVDGMLSRLEGF